MPEAEVKSGVGSAWPTVRASIAMAPVDFTLSALSIAALTSLSTTFSASATAIEIPAADPAGLMATATAAAPAVVSILEESSAVTLIPSAEIPAATPAPSPSIEPSTVILMRLAVCAPAPLSPRAFLPTATATEAAPTTASISPLDLAATVSTPAACTLVSFRYARTSIGVPSADSRTFSERAAPIDALPALLVGAIAAETDAATTVALMAASLVAVSETPPALVIPLSTAKALVLPPIELLAAAPPPLKARALPLLE